MALSGSVGRPRSAPRRRHGATAREEILDAAAELFTQLGYAATSTRAIAEAVGVKQASLYYHFANKEQILFDLLLSTVAPSRDAAAALAGSAEDAAVQLWALAAYDVRLLCTERWNLGALYLLPELRADRFLPFHTERRLLREDYGRLVAEGLAAQRFRTEDPVTATHLVFGLVEAVISMRQEPDLAESVAADAVPLGSTVADGALRLLGVDGAALRPVRGRAQDWLARYRSGSDADPVGPPRWSPAGRPGDAAAGPGSSSSGGPSGPPGP
jgi:AcrR family transcriptional regulator